MTVAAARQVRVLSAVLALELAVAGAVAVSRQPAGPSAPAAARVQARAVPDAAAQRTAAVRALLDGRSRAVPSRDRAAFLAGVDPRSAAFASRQAALFDALEQVPVSAWAYTLDPAGAQPPDPVLDARYGSWWAPAVELGVALSGIDDDPVAATQALTFVQRDGAWLIASDDDFVDRGDVTEREVWDGGPVSVVRGAHTLVLGHPGGLAQMRQLVEEVDAAVPRVTAVWGPDWPQRLAVVVPADAAELGRIVPTRGSLAPIAALAVARPVHGRSARSVDRVYVNPGNLALLGAVGRRVVLTHEVTHVASRAATGVDTPTWLSEGLADHVGFLGAGVPVRAAAAELRADVGAGRVPTDLPVAADFSGDNPALSQAYEQAWLAVELMVTTYGQDRVLALYRDLGGRRAPDPQEALDEALRTHLGIDLAQLTVRWRAALRQELS